MRVNRKLWCSALDKIRHAVKHETVHVDGEPYLERWIISFGLTLRLHKFHRGDAVRALHDHPWWFVTFPLQAYEEVFWKPSWQSESVRIVRPYRLHFRGAKHRHKITLRRFPTWTVVLTGPCSNDWGFWLHPNKFIAAREWAERE